MTAGPGVVAAAGSAGAPEPAGAAGSAGAPEDSTAAVARAWASAVAGTSYVSLPPPEVEALLRGLVGRLRAALHAEPFRADAGREVGAVLVDAHFTTALTLSQTLAVLMPAAEQLDVAPDVVAERWPGLLGALAEGYASALQERALREQEHILDAALTARQQAEQALRASEERFHAVFTGARVGIGIGDLAGRILDVNPALVELFGYPAEEFRRRRVQDMMHPSDAEHVWRLYEELVRGEREHFRVEKQFQRADGEPVWTHLTVSLLRDADGRPTYQLALIHDVTDLHLLQTRLRHEAEHDPLTGLPNRTLFLDQLHRIVGAADEDTRLGLCFLDLDGFKAVNDTLGHEVGDLLLVEVAHRLNEVVTADGQLVARLGGDEFVLLVTPSPGREAVIALAERVLAALAAPIVVEARALSVSASIGIVERPVAGADPAELLRAADMTLYWAKADGKSRWAVFEPERNARDLNRYSLSAALPGALAAEHFVVHYQPLLRIASGRLHGVEALIRWQHPTRGLLGPDEFVGLAEESGLIVALSRWVLQTACRQGRDWFGADRDAPFVSVNLPAQQLRDPGLLDDVRVALHDSGLCPPRLQLEITESAVIGTDPITEGTLRALSEMGVRLAIDDFGTGYSNLAYLRQLPIDELKLAGSFLRGLRSADGVDPVDREIVSSLVSLAHVLGLTVTAEGIETAEQVRHLLAVGCDAGQGTYFGAAADAAATAAALHLGSA